MIVFYQWWQFIRKHCYHNFERGNWFFKKIPNQCPQNLAWSYKKPLASRQYLISLPSLPIHFPSVPIYPLPSIPISFPTCPSLPTYLLSYLSTSLLPFPLHHPSPPIPLFCCYPSPFTFLFLLFLFFPLFLPFFLPFPSSLISWGNGILYTPDFMVNIYRAGHVLTFSSRSVND